MSSWADREAVANFVASLSDNFPERLYIFESTAKGLNDFHERWLDAKNAITIGTIFIGWWRMENYSVSRETLIYKCYGGDPPTGEEMTWIQAVKYLYKHDITKEQLAWWRWQLAEKIHDEHLMMQYYPPTEEDAFILSGYRFFDIDRLQDCNDVVKRQVPAYYRYRFGPTYDSTEIYPCAEPLSQLKVWKEADPRGFYVIGADPAYGSSYEADRYAIQVFRCWTNRIEQVAEYCTTQGDTYQFAWILAHLCGYYRNAAIPTTLVLEINGPGQTVMSEFFRLQQYPQLYAPRASSGLGDVIAGIQNYLYTRCDSVNGAGYNYQWKTTADLKEYAMNSYRDSFHSDQMVINSTDLVEEMRYIQQDETGIKSATTAVHDDLVMAAMLAIEGWKKWLLPDLYSMGVSWESQMLKVDNEPGSVLGYNLQNYLQQYLPQKPEVQ